MVCADADRSDAERVAAGIQQRFVAPFDVDGDLVNISASIGIALAPPYAASDLLRFGDAAMYDAKARGRRRLATFRGTESPGSKRHVALTSGLREALDDGPSTLGYQPIMDFDRGVDLGLEALLRWEHPDLGPVPPEEVLRAEAAGLSFELDRAVMRAAGDDLVRLREEGVVSEESKSR